MKKILLIFIIITVTFGCLYLSPLANSNETPLFGAILAEDTGNTVTSNIQATVDLGYAYLSESDKEDFIISLADALGISSSYNVHASYNEDCFTTSFYKESKSACTSIKLSTFEQHEDNHISFSQTLFVNIDFNDFPDSAMYYRDVLKNFLNSKGIDNTIYITYKGYLNGRINTNNQNAIVLNISNKLNGRIIDNLTDLETFSAYGYINNSSDYVRINGYKVNYNIAFSYNELTNTTQIQLASPIIKEDF